MKPRYIVCIFVAASCICLTLHSLMFTIHLLVTDWTVMISAINTSKMSFLLNPLYIRWIVTEALSLSSSQAVAKSEVDCRRVGAIILHPLNSTSSNDVRRNMYTSFRIALASRFNRTVFGVVEEESDSLLSREFAGPPFIMLLSGI